MLKKPVRAIASPRIGVGREWVVGVGSGVIATALWAAVPRIVGAVSPGLKSLWLPVVAAVPWWLSLPILFFAVFGFVSMFQKIMDARAASVHSANEPATPAMIDIDLRRTGGALLMRGAMAKQFWVYLKLTNFAPYPLRVRHISIDVWFGQPTLKLRLDRPFEIPPRCAKDDVGLSEMPGDETISKIQEYLSSENFSKELTLYVSVVAESDGGSVDKTEGLHIREPELSLVVR